MSQIVVNSTISPAVQVTVTIDPEAVGIPDMPTMHQLAARLLQASVEAFSCDIEGALATGPLFPAFIAKLEDKLQEVASYGASIMEAILSGETDPEVFMRDYLNKISGEPDEDQPGPFDDYIDHLPGDL